MDIRFGIWNGRSLYRTGDLGLVTSEIETSEFVQKMAASEITVSTVLATYVMQNVDVLTGGGLVLFCVECEV